MYKYSKQINRRKIGRPKVSRDIYKIEKDAEKKTEFRKEKKGIEYTINRENTKYDFVKSSSWYWKNNDIEEEKG